ncbi:hypothetical protein N7454_001678 [Penicillium verhagenii]|nr:hypothetical protein N7454_001678 [Penicillium verhagenii]
MNGPITREAKPYLAAIRQLIGERASEILHKRNFGGGWEKWLQLEIAAELDAPHTIDVLCEQRIWPNSTQQIDFWLQDPEAHYDQIAAEMDAREQVQVNQARQRGLIHNYTAEQLVAVRNLKQQVGIELKCRTYKQTDSSIRRKFLEDVAKILTCPRVPSLLVALAVTDKRSDVEGYITIPHGLNLGGIQIYRDQVYDGPNAVPLWLLYAEKTWA